MEYRLRPCGDAAALIELPGGIDPAVNARVHALARALDRLRPAGVREWVPAYRTVLLEYDPGRLDWPAVQELVRAAAAMAAGETAAAAGRTVTLPVVYGGEYGPDLPAVAAHTGLPADEVVRRHAAPEYRVYCLGYSPGFCYLGGMDPALATPRLASPRLQVPAGSVGIAGPQTGVYPGPAPGGWQIIGRTPVRLFDPDRDPPSLVLPGDTLRFEPVTAARFPEAAAPAPASARETGEVGIRVLAPGLQTTVQDLGRPGYQAIGVPVSGAADPRALQIGNALVGNRAGAAALEMTLAGPEIEFSGPVAFCLAGAAFAAELVPAGGGSPRPVPPHTALLAGPGDRLKVGPARQGCRAYLCVSGGIEVPRVLGSRSTDLLGQLGPFGGRPLAAGDWLPVGEPLLPPADLAGKAIPTELAPPPAGRLTVRVVPGPQAEAFSLEALDTLQAAEFRVGPRSDRQGLRLEGPPLRHRAEADIISEGVPLGAIQVPAGGEPILLLAGRQTTGGYAKIAVAVSADAGRAAQLRPGDPVSFRAVSVAEAHAIARAEDRSLAEVLRFVQAGAGRPAGEVSLGPVVIRERLREMAARIPDPVPPGAAAAPAAAERPATSRWYVVRLEGREFQVQVEEEPA